MDNATNKLLIQGYKEQILTYEKRIGVLKEMVRERENSFGDNGEDKPSTNLQSGVFKLKLDDGYPRKMSIENKVVFLIKNKQRFLHVREIANLLYEKEPGIDNNAKKPLVRRLATILNIAQGKKKVVKFKVGSSNRNCFWGSIKWLDESGEIKPEHKYDEKYFYIKKEVEGIEI